MSLSSQYPSLHDMEFLYPVTHILEKENYKFSIMHYSSPGMEAVEEAECVILCGSALGDEKVLGELEKFHWMKTFPGYILGIGTGANVLSLIFDGGVEECLGIGMARLCLTEQGRNDNLLGDMDGKEVFSIHTHAPVIPENFVALASTSGCTQCFVGLERIYGILFHPEVRHESLLARFCGLYDVI